MANRIKGITIQLGGDTTGLDKAISKVNTNVKKTQSELKEVDKLLKFNPGNADLIAQKQEILAKQVQNTSDKLKTLKEAQSQVDAQFAQGKINDEQYRAFQREVINTEQSLTDLKAKLESVGTAQKELESKTKQLDTLFEATRTSVERYADTLGVGLVNAIKSGRASATQLDVAISKVGKEALGTSIDVDKMKQALKSVDDGASIKEVQKDLSLVSKEAKNAGDEVNKFGMELIDVAAGLAAGGGIAGIVQKSLDVSSLNTKIDITFDVPEESKQAVYEVIRGIESYGIDAESALEGVRRQWALNKDASDQANASIVEGAAAISIAFSGIDFTELIQETNEIAAGLKITNEEALGLTDALLKAGFPPEQLDTISEYGMQMKNAGFSVKEIQAIFEKGIDTKSWNIDNLNDGVKEARIRMAEFGQEVPKALSELLQGTDVSAKKMQEWGKAVASGGEEGSKAMSEMVTWLDGIEDKSLKNALATEIMGTMWEDQGQNLISVFKGVEDAADKTKGNIDGVKETTEAIKSDPLVQMQLAFSDTQTALAPLLTKLAEFVTKIAEWISENPKLAAAIAAVVTVVGILAGIFMALAPIISGITAALPILGTVFAALTGPVGIVIAIITALIAVVILLWKNWGEITDWLQEKWDKFVVWLGENILKLVSNFSTWFTNMKDTAVAKFEELKTNAGNAISTFKENTINKVVELKNDFIMWIGQLIMNAINKFIELKDKSIEKITSMKTNIINKVTEMKNDFVMWLGQLVLNAVNKFVELKNKAEEKMNAVKEKMLAPIREARDKISDFIEEIKGFFSNLKLKIPTPNLPKLPHFKLKTGSKEIMGKNISYPTGFDVDWYDKGGVFYGPQIIGVGEKRPEFVGALDDLYTIVKSAMRDVVSPSTPSNASRNTGGATQDFIVNIQPQPIFLDGRKIAEVTYKDAYELQQRDLRRNSRAEGV